MTVERMALLGAGETVNLFSDEVAAEYDAVAAVNRAAAFLAREPGRKVPRYAIVIDAYTYPMIRWAAADASEMYLVSYFNEWMTMRSRHREAHALRGLTIEAIAENVEREDRPGGYLRREDEWRVYGVTVGLALGVHLGATRIDCFGVDRRGVADFDGFHDRRQRRTPRRWIREKRIWQKVCDRVGELGIQVRRIGWREENQPQPKGAETETATCASP